MDPIKLRDGELAFGDKAIVYTEGPDSKTTLVLSKITSITYHKRNNLKIITNGLLLGLLVAFGGGFIADATHNDDVIGGIVWTGIIIFIISIILYFLLIMRTLSIKTAAGEITIAGRIPLSTMESIEQEILKRV